MSDGVLDNVDVVVLAGGLGTRLSSVLTETPKILAPIAGRPFLDHLLDWLVGQGARRVVLALGSRAGAVLRYLETHPFPSLEILTVVEPHPLGTAGAIGFALPCLGSDPVLVVNGDTLVNANLAEFVVSHRRDGATASVLCARVSDAQRYGSVEMDSAGRIVRFWEKNSTAASSWVNAGVYLFNRNILNAIAKTGRGSLERDFLEAMPPGAIHAFTSPGSFLDIGTPESFARAAAFLEDRSVNRERPSA
jgi:NDP-sugar pyrophosphorylase family protein